MNKKDWLKTNNEAMAAVQRGLRQARDAVFAGPIGSNGPNDYGYINIRVRQAADLLVRATKLYCEGHYPHSNARELPHKHPLAKALRALAKADKETAFYANTTHDPTLFAPYQPTEAAKHRWDVGPVGEVGPTGPVCPGARGPACPANRDCRGQITPGFAKMVTDEAQARWQEYVDNGGRIK